jgi:hypothetical protein
MLWHPAVWHVNADVSEETATSIYRAEELYPEDGCSKYTPKYQYPPTRLRYRPTVIMIIARQVNSHKNSHDVIM